MRNSVDIVIYRGIPLLVAFGFCYFGMPWYVVVLVLLSSVYWYGPVLVYLVQRMPAFPSLRSLDSDATLPPAHSRYFDKMVPLLQGAGFIQIGRFGSAIEKQSVTGTTILLQHQETFDLAHLLIATQEGQTQAAETLVFSRIRTDGSRILTSRNTVQSPFPSNRSDSVLRLYNRIDPLDLWRVHQARVAADAGAVRNATVTDAFAFQMELEKDGIRRHVASGLWQQDEGTRFLRPTAIGAVLMCLRMLPPWKQVARIHARLQMRRYLRRQLGQPPSHARRRVLRIK